ncbi:MAG: 30S ribosomal protein S17e [Methanomicrobiales archaeon]|nr:30S ribosomal protein S17e [Methanomicrobiales archaeon]
MGIKPTYIKTLGEELIAKHGGRFSRDFEENKLAVAELALIESKRVRNRVAGNITRRLNRKKRI